MIQGADGKSEVQMKVDLWLSGEGYPLEFEAAHIMQQHGFNVRQGYYAQRRNGGLLHEIDVLASLDSHNENTLLRAYNIVECKYSKDKPWVVFVSDTHRMSTAACAAQTIASNYGSAVMWALSGHDLVAAIDLFHSPEMGGFNGRQAFSKGADQFYNSLKSVVENTVAVAEQFDERPRHAGELPDSGCVAFPIILVEGKLFEAFYDHEKREVMTRETGHVRCHWRGSTVGSFLNTIDIVVLDEFDKFCAKRAEETSLLLDEIGNMHEQIELCFRRKSFSKLKIHGGSRGFIGSPTIFREAQDEWKSEQETSRQKDL